MDLSWFLMICLNILKNVYFLLQVVRKAVTAGYFANACHFEVSMNFLYEETFHFIPFMHLNIFQ